MVACYGLAFKADIDDLRESPAIDIAKGLSLVHPGKVWAVQPHIKELPKMDAPLMLVNVDKALEEAHIHVVLVGHKIFKEKKFPVPFLKCVQG